MAAQTGSDSGTVNIQKAAKLLGVAVETVRRYLRDGKRKGHKVRVKGLKEEWAIREADLRTFTGRQLPPASPSLD